MFRERPFADIKPEFFETNVFVEEAYCRAYMMKEHKCWHGCRCSHGRERKAFLSFSPFFFPSPPFLIFSHEKRRRRQRSMLMTQRSSVSQCLKRMGGKGGRGGGEAPHCIPVRKEIHPPEVKTDTSESILCLGRFLPMQRSGKGMDCWRFPALDAFDGMW